MGPHAELLQRPDKRKDKHPIGTGPQSLNRTALTFVRLPVASGQATAERTKATAGHWGLAAFMTFLTQFVPQQGSQSEDS